MITLKHEIRIKASRDTVWRTMLEPETYRKWANAFSPESQYRGEWRQGTYMEFIDPNRGGTKALLESVVPSSEIHARHVAVLDKDGNEDSESDTAKQWIGSTESYSLVETSGVTILTVVTKTDPSFEPMFAECWPKALEQLKALCESRSA